MTDGRGAAGRDEVEVAHEALIRHWPRLRGWLDEDRASLLLLDSVRRAAMEWEAAGWDTSLLVHQGSRLARVMALVQQQCAGLTHAERRYLDSCVARQSREEARDEELRRTDLARTGWGVIFAQDAAPALRDALGELLGHRRRQATRTNERYYREYTGGDGYRPGESAQEFLARHGAGYGPADPENVPYYLLIVGDPEAIPFSFQCQLDVQYAVGRLHFDTLDGYSRYARSVVTAETGGFALPRRAAFFGVQHPDDRATGLAANVFVRPMAELFVHDQPGWGVRTVLDEDATKERLATLLGGADTPALLLTVGHGMGFPNGDPRQLPDQGALLCRDWPGPLQHQGPLCQDFYLAAADVGDDARLLGSMVFLFAEYGAGTPRLDDFPEISRRDPMEIAPVAFVARLPQRLLGHPNGGALAVIGHVDRTWTTSFLWEGNRQLQAFRRMLKRLAEGYPVGPAMEDFNARYAVLAAALVDELKEIRAGKAVDEWELTSHWWATYDARNWVILGDPAARVVSGEGAAVQAERATIEPIQSRLKADSSKSARERAP